MRLHALLLAAWAFWALSAAALRAPGEDFDLLPGWKAETYHAPNSSDPSKPWMEVAHADARIFLFHNFLTSEEADHIISLATPQLKRSGVVETKTGSTEISKVRTSRGTFLQRGQDPIIKDIEERIARWTLMPVDYGEPLQVLKYEVNEEYEGHYDYFFHAEGTANGGNRYATVLTYLSTVEEGGETVFPNIPAPGGDNGPSFSECARKSLAVKPRKGDAVLFHSIKPSGEMETRSLHTACPVKKGVKWSAPKWIHVGHYAQGGGDRQVKIEQHPQKVGRVDGCKDADDKCGIWAQAGECQKNPGFMVGTPGKAGMCVLACNRCEDIMVKVA